MSASDKHTYNLCMVFGVADSVTTIVCYHDNEINSGMVRMIAQNHLNQLMQSVQGKPIPAKAFVDAVLQGLQNDYPGLQTVVVKSDAILGVIHRSQNPLSNLNPG